MIYFNYLKKRFKNNITIKCINFKLLQKALLFKSWYSALLNLFFTYELAHSGGKIFNLICNIFFTDS